MTCPPHNHKQFDLATGVEAVLLCLLESTKTFQNKTVDVVIAWQTSLGLCIGEWMLICRSLRPPHLSSFIFQDNNGDRWTSTTFRHKFLIPLLEYKRLEGDPYLTPYDGTTPRSSISHIFYSLHSYRRGGRSDASLKRMGSICKATQDEIEEHDRWRQKNILTNEPIPLHYRSWSVEDRVYLTLLCM